MISVSGVEMEYYCDTVIIYASLVKVDHSENIHNRMDNWSR